MRAPSPCSIVVLVSTSSKARARHRQPLTTQVCNRRYSRVPHGGAARFLRLPRHPALQILRLSALDGAARPSSRLRASASCTSRILHLLCVRGDRSTMRGRGTPPSQQQIRRFIVCRQNQPSLCQALEIFLDRYGFVKTAPALDNAWRSPGTLAGRPASFSPCFPSDLPGDCRESRPALHAFECQNGELL